ncbi:MAG: leucine-rich repeat protein [Muribaculaceae bacterium]|nr:leucine-rich repeat protein [Muribaculaceae bacterium]
MKKILTLLAILLAFSVNVFAYDFKVDGICYDINEDGKSVTVTFESSEDHFTKNYSNLSGNIVIPENVVNDGKSYLVTSIGQSAFYSCSGLTTMTIGNSVTSIDERAFCDCSGLTSVSIGKSVTSIGIGAFYLCKNLNSVTIPNSVTSIGNGAFSDCSNLTSVVIPKSVTSIGHGAFVGCNGLTLIVVENGNSKYDSRSNCNAIIETESNTLITGCNNTIIPNSVTTIGHGAFHGCIGLTSMTIPNSVTEIDDGAFESCSGLASVTIPKSLTSIGESAFYNCSGLTGELTIPNSVTSIGYQVFYGCTGLSSVNLPNTLTEIGESAFYECSSLTSIIIPKSVKRIGSSAFYGCSGLKGKLTIPNSVTEIGEEAFKDCSSLTSINILKSLTSIGKGVFSGCTGLTSVTIPNSVSSIGDYAFHKCSGITSINIPKSVKTIGSHAFYGCSGLTGELIIPNSVTDIGSYAFSGCSGLTSVTISRSVTWIGEGTFCSCNGLTSVTVQNPNTTLFRNAFTGCDNLKENFILNIVEGAFKVDGICYKICDDEESVVVTFEESDNDSTINYSTNNYSNLDGELVIPERVEYKSKSYLVTSIGDNAFKGCTGLTGELTIPSSVTEIGNNAFEGCTRLTGELTIPNSVTRIGSSAFSGCTGLTGKLTTPNSVIEIGSSAFKGCTGLTGELTISDSVIVIGNGAFEGCTGFTGELTLPNSVIVIGDDAFNGCTGLTGELTIPNSVIEIGDSAFEGCTGLTGELTIPNSVTSIGHAAFEGCTGLTKVTIPNSVRKIATAFWGCSGLESIYSMIREPQNVNYLYGGNVFGYENGHVGRDHKISIFKNVNKDNCKIYVPINTSHLYKDTCPWYDFTNIIEYDYGDMYETTPVQNLDSLKHQFEQLRYSNLPYNVIEAKGKEIRNLMMQIPEFFADPANYDLMTRFGWYYYAIDKDYYRALLCYEAAIKIKENTQGDDKSLIDFHRYVAKCYDAIKQYDKAKYHYKKVLELCKNNKITKDTDLYLYCNISQYLMEIGKYFIENEEYIEAKNFFDEAIRITRAQSGENNDDIADLYYKIADLYYNKQQFDDAINNFEEFIKLLEDSKEQIRLELANMSDNSLYYEKLKSDEKSASRKIAEALEIIAGCHNNNHQCDKAIEKLEEADKIYKDINGESPFRLQYSLGCCYYNKKNYDEAIKYFKKIEDADDDFHKTKIDVLRMIGKCHYANHDTVSAMYYYQEAMTICRKEFLDENNPLIGYYHQKIKILCEIISLCKPSDDDLKSFYGIFRQTLDKEQKEIIRVFNNIRNETDRAGYWYNQSKLFQYHYPAVAWEVYKHKEEMGLNYNDIRGDMYNKCALFAKGLLLTSENEWRRIILDSGNPNLIAKYHKLLTTTNKKNTDELEQELFEFAMERYDDDYLQILKTEWTDVKKNLGDKDKSIAIEFLSFPKLGTNDTVYIALTIRNNDDYREPKMTFLCEEKDLKAAMKDAYTSNALSKLIWEPLAKELNGVDTIYFSPSGLLHTIAIESLPHWENPDVLMCDTCFSIYRLSSTRELVIKHKEIECNEAVLYGGMDYDCEIKSIVEELKAENSPAIDKKPTKNKSPEDVAHNDLGIGSRLPEPIATMALGDDWKNAGVALVKDIEEELLKREYTVDLRNDKKANETSVKLLSGKEKKVIVFHTHGFYWDNESAKKEKASFRLSKYPDNHQSVVNDTIFDPMTCCGLAFSGGNHVRRGETIDPPDADDEVLTAMEVADLDLRGLELVVLAACETGQGEIGSDGVFGLQRGFKKAGAHCIIMSLWTVNNEATKTFMRTFFMNWKRNCSMRKAFVEAQKEVKRIYGNEYDDKEHKGPHWAAFILLDALEE